MIRIFFLSSLQIAQLFPIDQAKEYIPLKDLPLSY
jgi:hypothetical protein